MSQEPVSRTARRKQAAKSIRYGLITIRTGIRETIRAIRLWLRLLLA